MRDFGCDSRVGPLTLHFEANEGQGASLIKHWITLSLLVDLLPTPRTSETKSERRVTLSVTAMPWWRDGGGGRLAGGQIAYISVVQGIVSPLINKAFCVRIFASLSPSEGPYKQGN